MIKRDALPLLPLVGLSAYFIASIFYVFPSGLPQPADYLLLATIALTVLFASRRLPRDRHLYGAAGLLIGWIVLVNGTWFLITTDYRFLVVITFYLFNMFVFLFVIAVANHDFRRLRPFIWWACIGVLLVQIVALHLPTEEETSRALGTFNNPNQLGYWGLLVMACLVVTKHRTPLTVWDVAALSVGLYAVVLSSSRAASVAVLLLLGLIVYFCRFEKAAGRAAVGGLVLALVAGGGSIAFISESEPVAHLLSRFEAREPAEDLAGRGYQRLMEYPQYLVLGAGEGLKERFGEDAFEDPELIPELHSSLGNLLFSYGVVGLALFCGFLFFALRGAPWPSIAYFGPVMLYGIGHMGLRFSLFWVLLGLIYAQGRHRLHRTVERRALKPQRGSKRKAAALCPAPVGAAIHGSGRDKVAHPGRSQRPSRLPEYGGAPAHPEGPRHRTSRHASSSRGPSARRRRGSI